MSKTLDAFNLGPVFKKWISILYNKPLYCVTNNGHSLETFEISRGIRPQCPISALLFILVAEIMAISIMNNIHIKGININGCTIGITQLADDTTFFVKDSDSVKHVLNMLEHFHRCAGLRLNKDKVNISNIQHLHMLVQRETFF